MLPDFTGLTFGSPPAVGGTVKVSVGAWSATPDFQPGDEWRVVLSGPSATDPVVRVTAPFVQTS